MSALTLAEAALLGVVEGLTEFIPVSSTGHLILVSHALGLEGPVIATFEIFIQLGAILAVVVLYRERFRALLEFSVPRASDLLAVSSFRGPYGLFRLALAAAPLFVLGALFGSTIKTLLFNPTSVAFALMVGGVLLLFVERFAARARVQKLEEITPKMALQVGLFQCLALWPGMSRSGSTIFGGVLLGMSRTAAAEFSFLVAVPVMFVATGVDLMKNISVLSSADVPAFAVGFVVSFVTALFAVKFFISMLGRVSLAPFAWYRIAAGALVLWWM
jgi:undecaprenyl-diphosphatase